MKLKDPTLLREAAFIAGEWCPADENAYAVKNPATKQLIAHVPSLSSEQLEQAIHSSQCAFESWRQYTGKERGAILRKWYELMLENIEDLAQILTAEQGKPITEARGEITYAASFLEWFSEEAKRGYGDVIPEPKRGQRIKVIKEPIGVCAAITPWNYPSAMITRKVAPALAAGCTVVLKPAIMTPLSAMALCVLAERAGLPKGVLSVVTGNSKMIGQVLAESNVVKKLSFTGSTEIGKTVMQQSSVTVKKLSLELGGNAPFIVFDDADLDAAVVGAMASKFRNAGQTCVCVNRFLVQRTAYPEFLAKLKVAVQNLKVGNGEGEDITIGPLVNADAVDKVNELVNQAVRTGACVEFTQEISDKDGFYCAPMILTDVTADMDISQHEIFGPVAAITIFDTEEEAVRLANATNYGLAAYFYTNDLNRSLRLERALEYGIIGVNEGLISTEVAPFGGVKESGFGKEGSYYGMQEYLDSKYICHGGVN